MVFCQSVVILRTKGPCSGFCTHKFAQAKEEVGKVTVFIGDEIGACGYMFDHIGQQQIQRFSIIFLVLTQKDQVYSMFWGQYWTTLKVHRLDEGSQEPVFPVALR